MPEDRDYDLEKVLQAYRLDGSLIRGKARALTEEGLDDLYRRMKDGDISTSAFLDILKYLAEIGDLKPKTSTIPQQQGPGFSITINVPNTTQPITIEGEAIPVQDEEGVMGEMSLKDIPIRQLGQVFDNKDLKEGSDGH